MGSSINKITEGFVREIKCYYLSIIIKIESVNGVKKSDYHILAL